MTFPSIFIIYPNCVFVKCFFLRNVEDAVPYGRALTGVRGSCGTMWVGNILGYAIPQSPIGDSSLYTREP